MGEHGPIPKRSDQRRRVNKPVRPVTKAAAVAVVEIPRAKSSWHPIAKMWFSSLELSGQSAFYVASDWATAYAIAESMSREFKPQPIGNTDDGVTIMAELPPKAASLAAWLKGMSGLLVTEGDRRRASLELQRPKPDAEEGGGRVRSIDAWRSRVDGTG